MRKFLNLIFKSHGTYMGYPRALEATKMVLGFCSLVILNTYGMVYMTILVTALDNFFIIARPSGDM